MRDDADGGRPEREGPTWQRPQGWSPFETETRPSSYPPGSPPNPHPFLQPRQSAGTSSIPWPSFDLLTWRQFEVASAEAFRAQGYKVTLTPDGADGGVDLVLERKGERVVVQCKHWASWKVGVKTVRELLGVMTAEGVARGIVVTSGRFTDEARRFARDVPVQLLDGRDMASMLVGVPVPAALAALSIPETDHHAHPTGAAQGYAPRAGDSAATGCPRCPRCGESMVIRTAQRGDGRGGQFWGCPRYPACRGVVGITTTQTHDRSAPPPPGARPLAGSAPPPAAHRRRKRKGTVMGTLVGLGVIVVGLALISTALRSLPSAFQGVTPPQPTTVAIPQMAPQTSSSSSGVPVGASISLTERPHQVAIDSEGRRLFVTNRDASSITVVDLATETTLATWPVERQPLGIAFDPVESTIWVTNYNDASVTVLTLDGEHIDSFPVGGGPESIAIDEVRHLAYVVNSLDRSVSVVDLSTRSVRTTQELGYSASGIAVDSVQGRVCMVQPQALRMLYCYDENLKLAGTLGSVGDLVAIDQVRHDRYGVRREGHGGLTAVNALTEEKVELPLDHVPTGIAVDAATRLVYITLPDAREILVLSPLA